MKNIHRIWISFEIQDCFQSANATMDIPRRFFHFFVGSDEKYANFLCGSSHIFFIEAIKYKTVIAFYAQRKREKMKYSMRHREWLDQIAIGKLIFSLDIFQEEKPIFSLSLLQWNFIFRRYFIVVTLTNQMTIFLIGDDDTIFQWKFFEKNFASKRRDVACRHWIPIEIDFILVEWTERNQLKEWTTEMWTQQRLIEWAR